MSGDMWQRHHAVDFRIARQVLPHCALDDILAQGDGSGHVMKLPWVPSGTKIAQCTICEAKLTSWVVGATPHLTPGAEVQAFFEGIRNDHIISRSKGTEHATIEAAHDDQYVVVFGDGVKQRVPLDYIFPEIGAKAFQTDDGTLLCGKCKLKKKKHEIDSFGLLQKMWQDPL